MKMFKKLAAVILVAALALTALVGCGSSELIQPDIERGKAVSETLNAYREAKGLDKLEFDEELTLKATAYANAQVDYIEAANAYYANKEDAKLKKQYEKASKESEDAYAELRSELSYTSGSTMTISGQAYDAVGGAEYFNKYGEQMGTPNYAGTKIGVTSVKKGSTEAIVVIVVK